MRTNKKRHGGEKKHAKAKKFKVVEKVFENDLYNYDALLLNKAFFSQTLVHVCVSM